MCVWVSGRCDAWKSLSIALNGSRPSALLAFCGQVDNYRRRLLKDFSIYFIDGAMDLIESPTELGSSTEQLNPLKQQSFHQPQPLEIQCIYLKDFFLFNSLAISSSDGFVCHHHCYYDNSGLGSWSIVVELFVMTGCSNQTEARECFKTLKQYFLVEWVPYYENLKLYISSYRILNFIRKIMPFSSQLSIILY